MAAAAVADKRSEVVDALVKRYAASAFPAEMTALMSKGDGESVMHRPRPGRSSNRVQLHAH